MTTITINNRSFAASNAREQLPTVLPHQQKQAKLKQYKALYDGTYSHGKCYQDNAGYLCFIFGKSNDYPLGECVKNTWRSEPNLIWCAQYHDAFAVVVIQDGRVIADELLDPAGSHDLFWLSLRTDGARYTLHHSETLPDELRELAESELITSVIAHERTLFRELQVSEHDRLVPLDEALTLRRSMPAWLVAAPVAIAAALIIWMWPQPSDDIATVVDHFAEYRQQLSAPSAAAVLVDVGAIMEPLVYVAGWSLDRCSANQHQLTLICDMKPRPSAQSSVLASLAHTLQRPVNIVLVNDVARLSIPLMPEAHERPYAVLPMSDLGMVIHDALYSHLMPDSVTFMEMTPYPHWSSQQISLSKKSVTLDALHQLSVVVSQLPVTLASIDIMRTGIGVDMDAQLTLLGQ